jgi:hypothetical protein
MKLGFLTVVMVLTACGSEEETTTNTTTTSTTTTTTTTTSTTTTGTTGTELVCGALEFDGIDNYLEVPADAGLVYGDTFTVEAWVHQYSQQHDWDYIANQGWAGSDNSFRLQTKDSDVYLGIPGHSGQEVNATIPQGQWVHIAAVYDNGTEYLFIDGVMAGSSASAGSPSSNPGTLSIGGLADHPTDYAFDGMIDEIRISSTARYNAGFTPEANLPSDTDTLALWTLSEGEGETAFDSSGNGHDGTINGAIWVEDCPN